MRTVERIAAVFENERTGEKIRSLLESTGVARVLCCRTAAEVKVLMGQKRIPTVVCGYKFPDGTAEELFCDLPEGRTMLLLARQDLLTLCEEPRIFKLASPLSRAALIDAVRQVVAAAGRDVRPPRSEKEEAMILRAKEWLMERYGVDEEQAHRLLQKRSMAGGRKLSDTARMVLEREAGIAIY